MTCTCIFKKVPKVYWSKLKAAKHEPAGIEQIGDFYILKKMRVHGFLDGLQAHLMYPDEKDSSDFVMFLDTLHPYVWSDFHKCEHVQDYLNKNDFGHYGDHKGTDYLKFYNGDSYTRSYNVWEGTAVVNLKEKSVYFLPYVLDMSKEIEDEDLFYDFLNHEDTTVSIEDMCDIEGSAFKEVVPENIIEQVIEYNYA